MSTPTITDAAARRRVRTTEGIEAELIWIYPRAQRAKIRVGGRHYVRQLTELEVLP